MITATFIVEGMTCGGCTSSLERLLTQEDGIESASASFEDNRCTVTFDPNKTSEERIAQIVADAGFEFKGQDAG